jgi:hypothetical protein
MTSYNNGKEGDLECTGKGSITISFPSEPRDVELHFTNQPTIIPCSPIKIDELDWVIERARQRGQRGWLLHIHWNVAQGARTVAWKARY